MLLYHRRSQPTGEKIAEALQTDHFDHMGFESLDDVPVDFLIRWGNSGEPEYDQIMDKVVNTSEAIQRATDKFGSLELFREAGLTVPDFDRDPEALFERVGFPILGRNARHARGTDIKLCLQKRDYARPRDFYTQYIPTKREFRVHVVGNEVVRVQGKYLDFPERKKAWIRNYESGYRFRNPRLRLHSERLQAAVTAVSAIGLDFGAVDLIIGDDNSTYILEVNTAPSCSPLTGAAYVTGIAGLLNGFGIEINLDALNFLESDMEDRDSDDLNDEEYDNELVLHPITRALSET